MNTLGTTEKMSIRKKQINITGNIMETKVIKKSKTSFKAGASFEANSIDENAKLGIYPATVEVSGPEVKNKYMVISLVFTETDPESTAGPRIFSIDSPKTAERMIKSLQKLTKQIWPNK